jgi:hypothetical protein
MLLVGDSGLPFPVPLLMSGRAVVYEPGESEGELVGDSDHIALLRFIVGKEAFESSGSRV